MHMKYLVQYHMYFSAGSHFTQNLKMTLLSLTLNLEAQYCTQIMDSILGLSHGQIILDLVYVEKKL